MLQVHPAATMSSGLLSPDALAESQSAAECSVRDREAVTAAGVNWEGHTSSLSAAKEDMLVSGVFAYVAWCPAVPLYAVPREVEAESSALCALRMESAVESTTCAADRSVKLLLLHPQPSSLRWGCVVAMQ